MKFLKIIGSSLVFVTLVSVSFAQEQVVPITEQKAKYQSECTFVIYIQADNNLDSYALYNINDMQRALLPSSVNVLVQWDQPNNKKTWRYHIVHNGRIEDASLNVEMGLNPEQEIVDMMKWAKAGYSAKRWCVILWNHGAGIIDPRVAKINRIINGQQIMPTKQTLPWLEIPGLSVFNPVGEDKERGILFDDSQNTYLSNTGLYNAFRRVKTEVLGKNIDIVGMDACLMAMLEVGYQIKDCVNILVGSEQTEPGEGWSYSGFLTAISNNPSMSATSLAAAIVSSYGDFYTSQTNDYTQSALNLSKMVAIKNSVVKMITAVAACRKADRVRTQQMVVAARRASLSFDVSDYIDLYSFYNALVSQARSKKKSAKNSFVTAANVLIQELTAGMLTIKSAVIANAIGSRDVKAKGISIYYPTYGSVHSSYASTKFAQAVKSWSTFVKTYR